MKKEQLQQVVNEMGMMFYSIIKCLKENSIPLNMELQQYYELYTDKFITKGVNIDGVD